MHNEYRYTIDRDHLYRLSRHGARAGADWYTRTAGARLSAGSYWTGPSET